MVAPAFDCTRRNQTPMAKLVNINTPAMILQFRISSSHKLAGFADAADRPRTFPQCRIVFLVSPDVSDFRFPV